MVQKNFKRCLSLIMALALSLAVLPILTMGTENGTAGQSTEPQSTAGSATGKTLAQIEAEIDDILMRYLGATKMSAEDIQAKVAAMDWETYQTARWEISELRQSIESAVASGGLTEAQLQELDNATLVAFGDFSDILDTRAASDNTISTLATSGTTASGIHFSHSHSDGTVSISGEIATLQIKKNYGSTQRVTAITVTNNTGNKAKIEFSYSFSCTDSNKCTFSINDLSEDDGAKGSITLDAGGTFSIDMSAIGDRWESLTSTLTITITKITPIIDQTTVTVQYDENKGSVNIGSSTGTKVANNGTVVSQKASPTTLVATPAKGCQFVAWVDPNDSNLVLCRDAEYTIQPTTATMTAKAIFTDTSSAWFYYNDSKNLIEGFANATAKGGTIALANNAILSASATAYNIPSGVTLLIPFDTANTAVTNDPENHLFHAYDDKTNETRKIYRSLTLASGANITVAPGGAISVGSQISSQFMGQVGPYGAIYMEGNSNITVQSGGALYCWGYIFHGEGEAGSGTVTVQSGGTVYEPMSIMDYPGSSSLTNTIKGVNVFPMRAYTIRNVEVPMTLNYGAVEYVFYCLWGNNIGTYPNTLLMFAKETIGEYTPAFLFGENTKVTKSYVNSTQYITVSGDISLNSMKVTIDATEVLGYTYKVEFSTSETSGFYIPSGFDVTVASGTFTLNDNVIMCEGSRVAVANGATLNTNSKNLYVLDATDDVGAVASLNGCSIYVQDVHEKYYTQVNRDAVLDVNGTLTASGGFYTSTNSAEIISTKGTGKITISGTSDATEVKAKDNNNSYQTISVNAAKLKNEDGTFVETAGNTEATTYYYIDGFWYNDRVRIDIVATNIAVNDGLDMWFYVEASNVDDVAKYKAVVTKHFADDRSPNPISETIPGGQWEPYNDGTTNYYRFCFSDISAKEMTDKITAVILRAEDNAQVSNTYEQTVQNYAINALEVYKTKTDAKSKALKAALMDMLEYGASAQVQFNYNTGVLANVAPEGVSTLKDHASYITTTDPNCVNSKAYDGSVAGVTVSATNTLMFTFYFNIANPDGMYAEIKYIPHGETAQVTLTVTAENFYERTAGSLYGVDVTALSIVDGHEIMTCTLYNSDGSTVATATDSIAGYALRNAEKAEVFMDMMRFVDSACKYFDTRAA